MNLRYNLLLLILCSVFFSCNSKKKEIVIIPDYQKNHLQRNRIFGNVKEMTTTVYLKEIIDSMEILTKLSSLTQHYSADGFLLKIVSCNPLDRIVSIKTIDYLSNAKEKSWIETDSLGNLLSRCDYEYDMNGYIVSEKHYDHDSVSFYIDFETDGVGNVISMNRHFTDFSLYNKIYYNDKGLVVKSEEYDPDHKLFKYADMEYDNYGDEVNRRVFQAPKKLIEYTYTQYDDQGNLIKVTYEDRLHHLKEERFYSNHDKDKNWMEEEQHKINGQILVRKRAFIYY
ncbi:MAG: hypothetical protein LBU51_10905 [Bacteroidales bacterium]|jgi:hypothetical protein|nr:hypothetical protein [Bacteroidales bacterium]